MEFIIDTVNLEDIKEAVEYMPIVGVTSNPSIVKKTSPKDFFKHMKEVREIIGKERSLHIQVISKECDEIVKEAHRILEEIDDQVYIKVPVSYEGIKAIKKLKAEGVNVTATAVYDLMQAYMALAAGADYIAPYVNRIGNLGNDPMELINELSNRIVQDGYDCKILAASFKGVQQVRDAFNYGSQAITAPVEVLKQIFANPSIEKAVNDYNSDWYDVYGEEGLKPRDKGVSIDPEIRVEAVKAVLTGQISQTQAAAKFNVAGAASVGKWMKVFSEHGEQGLRSLRVGKKRALHMIDDPVALEVALERSKDKHIQELERKVRSLELRVLYLKKLKALVR